MTKRASVIPTVPLCITSVPPVHPSAPRAPLLVRFKPPRDVTRPQINRPIGCSVRRTVTVRDVDRVTDGTAARFLKHKLGLPPRAPRPGSRAVRVVLKVQVVLWKMWSKPGLWPDWTGPKPCSEAPRSATQTQEVWMFISLSKSGSSQQCYPTPALSL